MEYRNRIYHFEILRFQQPYGICMDHSFGNKPRQGFLGMTGLVFRKSRLSGNLSATVFETDDYDTRIYAYEPDLLYNFSLPAYYGKGYTLLLNLHRDLSRLIGQVAQAFPVVGMVKMGIRLFIRVLFPLEAVWMRFPETGNQK